MNLKRETELSTQTENYKDEEAHTHLTQDRNNTIPGS